MMWSQVQERICRARSGMETKRTQRRLLNMEEIDECRGVIDKHQEPRGLCGDSWVEPGSSWDGYVALGSLPVSAARNSHNIHPAQVCVVALPYWHRTYVISGMTIHHAQCRKQFEHRKECFIHERGL